MSSIRKSFFWSAVEQTIPQIVKIVITIILARLLEPAEFGLIGMLAFFMGIARIFADSGLSASLIQRQEITADDETSVFALNIVLGIILAALLYVIAPLVAGFYNASVLLSILRVNAISVVISSCCIVQKALLSRAMQFHKTAFACTISTIASGFFGVIMAYFGYGVWSLVVAEITFEIVQAGLLWCISEWRPRGRIKLQTIKEVWNFSSYLLYCQLIGVSYQNIYSVIIGKFYSAESLGFYNRANTIRMIPASTMSGIVNRVTFPLFSKYQNDKVLMLKIMRELVRSSLLLSCAGMGLLAVIAAPLVSVLLTDKWNESVPLLRILCYGAITYPVHAIYLMALQAQGYSNLNFRLETIKICNGLLVVAVTYQFGTEVLAWGAVLLSIIAYFINAWYNVKLLNYRWRDQAFDIIPIIVLCFLAGLAAWLVVKGGWISGHNSVLLMVQPAVFASILGIGIYLFRHLFFADAWKHVNSASCWSLALIKQQTFKC